VFCSKPQQYKMAKYCEEILGDYLLKRPLDNVPVFFFNFCGLALEVNYYLHYVVALCAVYEIIFICSVFWF